MLKYSYALVPCRQNPKHLLFLSPTEAQVILESKHHSSRLEKLNMALFIITFLALEWIRQHVLWFRMNPSLIL